jgi:hypothetical protein
VTLKLQREKEIEYQETYVAKKEKEPPKNKQLQL